MTYDAATETNPLYIIAAVYISGPLRGSTCFCLHSSNICRSPVNLLSRRTVIWMTVLPLSKFLQRRFRQILETFALLSWKQNPRHVFTLLYAKEKFSLIARDCKMIEHRSRWSFCRNFHNIGYNRYIRLRRKVRTFVTFANRRREVKKLTRLWNIFSLCDEEKFYVPFKSRK